MLFLQSLGIVFCLQHVVSAACINTVLLLIKLTNGMEQNGTLEIVFPTFITITNKLEPGATPSNSASYQATDTVSSHSPITGCHDGWIAYEGICYLFASNAIRFVEAEHYCQQNGGHLVEPFNSLQNAFIKDELKRLAVTCAWLGLTDELTEGSWRWYNSPTPLNYTDWYPVSIKTDNEDCGLFWKEYGYQWGDLFCSYDCIPVCQQRGAAIDPEIVG